ncbi:MAG: DoxX family protein [Kineosporiaceae bacterium]
MTGSVMTPAPDTTTVGGSVAHDAGFMLVRAVPALGLGYHGLQKLRNPEGAAGLFEAFGFPAPQATAVLTGSLEVAVALLLLIGALTTLAAAGVIGIMTVAITRVHWDFGFPFDAGAAPGAPAPVPGYEYPLALLLVAAALAATGPGRRSVDATVLRRLPGPVRGGSLVALAVAVVLGVVGGGLVSALA